MSTPSPNPVRIMLIDNHALVRIGLRMVIEREPGLIVVGEAGSAGEALAIVAQEQPDIILFEPNLPDCLGVELISQLTAVAPRTRVLLVTGLSDAGLHHRAVQLGATGIVLKQQTSDVLVKATRKVYAGEAWLDRSMVADVITKLSRGQDDNRADSEAEKIALLSPREREVIALIGEGFKNKQIADRLSISEATARHHLTSIFAKLDVSDRLELIIFAYRHGLAQLPR